MMDIEEIKQFLNETDEGKALVESFKEPLLNKRTELFAEMKALKDDLESIKSAEQRKADELKSAERAKQELKLKSENDFEAYKVFHDEEVNKYKTEVNDLRKGFAQKEAERVIAETAMKHSKSPKPLQYLLKERVKSEIDEQGNVRLNVFDDQNQQMYFDGEPASVEHLVETLKSQEDFAPFFAASGASGTGTTKSEPVNTSSHNDMNSPEFNLSRKMGNKL